MGKDMAMSLVAQKARVASSKNICKLIQKQATKGSG